MKKKTKKKTNKQNKTKKKKKKKKPLQEVVSFSSKTNSLSTGDKETT
jgi:hypothetical protein